MTDKSRKSKQFLTNWPSSHAPKYTSNESTKTASINEETLDQISTNELQQGELYILKIKLIAIALFQGWDDEMCCFSVLRTDLLEELRWSEARYLPENFDAYLAFDYAGNPPIHLWTKQLRAVIPINWFNIFEEARHMQRQWNVSYWEPTTNNAVVPVENHQSHYYALTDNNPTIEEIDDDDIEENDEKTTTDEYKSDTTEEKQETVPNNNTVPDPSLLAANQNRLLLSESPTTYYSSSPSMPTPAMRLQKQYKLEVTQQQQQQQQQQQAREVPIQPKKSKSDQQQQQKKPEMKQRRSFSSFFLKKKKSKKNLRDEEEDKGKKRASAPPTPSIDTTVYTLKPVTTHTENQQSVSESNEETSSTSSPVVKTPKNDADHGTKKVELFDIDSYFDMQATFAFLNNTNKDNFSVLDNASSINNNTESTAVTSIF